MLTTIVLLILAVLLFGSSAVIGVLGVVLGFIAAAVALVWGSIAFDLAPGTILLFVGIGLAAFLALGAYANHWLAQEPGTREKDRNPALQKR